MVTLFIDTATDFLFLALVRDEKVIDSLVASSEKKHSDTALYTVQDLLAKNAIQKQNISRICIGAGPGSYSGIRIARTIAKMVRLVSKIECYQFSTLEFLQALIQAEAVALYAGRNQLYTRMNNQDQLVLADAFSGVVFNSEYMHVPQKISYQALVDLTLADIDEAPSYIKEALA